MPRALKTFGQSVQDTAGKTIRQRVLAGALVAPYPGVGGVAHVQLSDPALGSNLTVRARVLGGLAVGILPIGTPVTVTIEHGQAIVVGMGGNSTTTVTGGTPADTSDFGAVGDGITDDTAAFQAALNSGAGSIITIPAGTYKITAPLVVTGQGTHIVGAGTSSVTLLAGAAINTVLVAYDYEQHWEDFTVECNSLATHGIVMYNARRSLFIKIKVKTATGSGWYGDLGYDTVDGNNNMIHFINCTGANCGAAGFEAPKLTGHPSDNNGWVLIDCFGTDNAESGLVLEVFGCQVYGGQYTDNVLYGIQIGRTGASYSPPQYNTLFHPWFEGNNSGFGWAVLRGSSNICHNGTGLQKYDAAGSASDNSNIETFAGNGGLEVRSFSGGVINSIGIRGTGMNKTSDAGTNADFVITPKGTGSLSTTRLSAAEATALVAGDYALSGGWGTTASVGTLRGHDMAGSFIVTSAGTGQGANPTITLTWKGGAWALDPVTIVARRTLTSQPAVQLSWVNTTTTLTITFNGTPVAGETYGINFHAIGR